MKLWIRLTKMVTELPLQKHLRAGYDHLKEVIKRYHKDWKDVCWTYFRRDNSRNFYYKYVNVKALRPWFNCSNYFYLFYCNCGIIE